MSRHVTQVSLKHLVSTLPRFEDHYFLEDKGFTLVNGTHAVSALKYLVSRNETSLMRLDARYAEHRIPAAAYGLVFSFEAVEICHAPSPSLGKWLLLQARLGKTFPVKMIYVEDLSAYSADVLMAMHRVFPHLAVLEHATCALGAVGALEYSKVAPFRVASVRSRAIKWTRDRPFDLALDPDDQPLSF